MQLAGTVKTVFEAQKGISKTTGNNWFSQLFVIETAESYPRKVAFEIRRPTLVNTVKEGQQVVVTFSISSREYQPGKYITTAIAERIGVNNAVGGSIENL